MISERKLSFLILDTLLNDVVYCKSLDEKLFDRLHSDYKKLREEFINQYELPNFLKIP
jgi:hypothetical protein